MIERCIFAFKRQLDHRFGRNIPGMIQIQIGKMLRHQIPIGESGAGVFRGIFSDIAGSLNCLADGFRIQIRGTCTAFVLPKINTDAQAIVLLMFDGLDGSHARCHRQTLRNREARLGLRRTFGQRHF